MRSAAKMSASTKTAPGIVPASRAQSVDLPTPAVPVTTNKGGRTKGRSSAQWGHRSTSPTAGSKLGKTLWRPQTSHVNGTPRSCRRDDLGRSFAAQRQVLGGGDRNRTGVQGFA